MQPHGWDPDWPTVAIVTGIVDVLEDGRNENAAQNVSRVIRLYDGFPAVIEPSIA
jgi:hypothetical protein